MKQPLEVWGELPPPKVCINSFRRWLYNELKVNADKTLPKVVIWPLTLVTDLTIVAATIVLAAWSAVLLFPVSRDARYWSEVFIAALPILVGRAFECALSIRGRPKADKELASLSSEVASQLGVESRPAGTYNPAKSFQRFNDESEGLVMSSTTKARLSPAALRFAVARDLLARNAEPAIRFPAWVAYPLLYGSFLDIFACLRIDNFWPAAPLLVAGLAAAFVADRKNYARALRIDLETLQKTGDLAGAIEYFQALEVEPDRSQRTVVPKPTKRIQALKKEADGLERVRRGEGG